MLKKLCLMLLVATLCSGTAFAKKAPKTSKAAPKAAPEAAAPAEDEFSDDGFVATSGSEQVASEGSSSGDEFEAADDGGLSRAQKEEIEERKKFEEDQRADEYANSLRRRDWLKDRLILEIGMGSRMPFMGETGMGMGFGAGVEYITRWHVGAYASFGFLPKGTDSDFDNYSLEGATGYKVGINYYLFPKNPIHLGFSASYGTVYFDHNITPDKDKLREIILVDGFQFDALVTYLSNEWYYLQFSFGVYYAPELGNSYDSGDNPSYRWDHIHEEWISAVVNEDGMSKFGIVFGVTIGFAFPEFFPDDTEKRRREREEERARANRRK